MIHMGIHALIGTLIQVYLLYGYGRIKNPDMVLNTKHHTQK
jgi:hypothetical protein